MKSGKNAAPSITDRKHQLLFVLCIACGAFMANLDITIVNTSLPTIARDFSATPNTVALVVILYQIFEAGLLLLFGKLGDIKGFRKVYTSGFIVFTAGSLMCGLSENIEFLLVSRAVQGLGGAMLFSVMMATVSTFLPAKDRGKGIGTVTLAAAVGVALGPPLGGLIATMLNWRWIFLVNVPVGIAAVVLGLKVIPREIKSSEKSLIDWKGAASSFLALSLFVYAVHSGHRLGWSSSVIIGCFLASVAFAAAFIVNERKSKHPLLQPKLFSNKNYTLAALAIIPSFATTSGLLFVFPFFLEIACQINTRASGFILMALAAGQLAGPYVGHLSDRFGPRRILLAGMAGSVLSFIWLITLEQNTGIPVITASLFFAGLVMGFEKAPNVQLAICQVPAENRGVAGSTLGVFRSLGILFGLLFFEKIFTLSLNSGSFFEHDELILTRIDGAMATAGFHSSMLFALAMRLAALALIMSMKKLNK